MFWVGVALIALSLPAAAGLFSSCDGASKEKMPDWVSKPDYSRPGYYVGVGSAEKDGKTKDVQMKAAEDNAKSNLVQRIEVTIRAENSQNTHVTNNGVEKDTRSRVIVSAEEVLRDLQVKDRWLDPDTCTQHTLMITSQQSVAQAKREKTMKNRLETFKLHLAAGSDREKNRDITVRGKFLDDARALLMDTDFSVLPDELGKDVYTKRLNEIVIQFNKESSQVRGRTALFALNQDGSLNDSILGKILDQLRAGNASADILMAECNTAEDCISRARERGFSMLALLNTNSQVSTSQMGALKGVITVSRTVYDIESHKIMKADIGKGEIIGWSDAELDWETAAEKAIQDLK